MRKTKRIGDRTMLSKFLSGAAILLGLSLATPSMVGAQWAGPCGCGEVSVTGEALYWGTSQCDFFFAFAGESVFIIQDDQSTVISGDYENAVVEPGYDWGVRVGIEYHRDCWFARARYLWLETNSRKAVQRGNRNTLVVPVFPREANVTAEFDTATGSTEEIYQDFGVTLGHQICRTCWSDFSLIGSAQGLCIRDRRRVTAVGETEFIINDEPTPAPINGQYEMDVNFLGFGLGFGGLGRAELGCGFSLIGEGEFLAIVGYKRVELDLHSLTRFFDLYNDQRLPTRHTPRSCMTPGLKGRLVLEYCHDLCCGIFCAHIGYESHFYYGVVETNQESLLQNDEPANIQAITENAGFGGLVLGASFSF